MAQDSGQRRAVWFWTTGGILFLLVAASAAPAPLYRVYQRQWGFSASTLTAVFAVYVLALLVTLLVAGSASDHLGRRPIIAAGLALEIAACLVFVSAGGVRSLIVARGLQGIAVGLTTGALSAALLDIRPRGELAPLLASTCATAGLAFGALSTSVLVQYGPAPTHLPWWLLLAGFVVGAGVVAAMPEPGEIRAGALASLPPRVSVPKPARAAFAVAVPCIAGSWALGGFYLSLGPSLVLQQLASTNVVWGGLSIALLCGVGAAASVARRRQDPRRMMLDGCCALVAGGTIGVAAIAFRLPAALFVSAAVAGVGFGPVFVGAFRTVVAIAPADDRAGVVAAIFTVAYVSFGAPALAAGFATTRFGLRPTGLVYSAAVVASAGVAAVSLVVRRGRPAEPTDADPCACPPPAPSLST